MQTIAKTGHESAAQVIERQTTDATHKLVRIAKLWREALVDSKYLSASKPVEVSLERAPQVKIMAADSTYKLGFPQSSIYRVDKTSSQRLSAPAKAELVKVVAEHLTSGHMKAVCPISGLTIETDFPIKHGFYFEAYHPVVHNIRAILKDADYYKQLSVEQKAGVILAALHFYRLLSTTTPAIALNVALVANIPTALLDTIIHFISVSAAKTDKAYPVLVLDAGVNVDKLQGWMNACYEVEHYDYDPVPTNLTTTDEKYKVPRLVKSDKQGSRLDAAAYDYWVEITAAELLPADLVKKARPFAKALVTNPSSKVVERLMAAVEEKWQSNEFSDMPVEEQASTVEAFISFVKSGRDTAIRLGLYPDLSNLGLHTESETIVEAVEVEAVVEETKPASSFSARVAAMKTKGLL